MSHYAQIENGIVTQVIVAKQDFVNTLSGVWLQTSYNTCGGIHKNGKTPLRKNYANIGYTYDSKLDAFIPPRPFKSWNLNKQTCLWESPIPYPNDGNMYKWDENILNWVLISKKM